MKTDVSRPDPNYTTYNKRNQLLTKTDPLNKISSFIYDNAGRLLSKTDRKNATINYYYTASGKLDHITYPDSTTVAYTYNNLDQLLTMTDSVFGTTQYNSYDAAGRLTSMTDPHGFVISYAYDDLGNVRELTYPGNKKVVYTYDNLNRLKTAAINWLSQTATYDDYDAAGRLPGFTNFNSTRTTYGYDNAGRITSINNKKADGISVIAGYAFTELDGNGNRKNIVQTEPYAPSLDEGSVAYSYNTQKNRLLSTSTDSFSYDDEGQLATSNSGAYTFDYEHRLKTIGSTNTQFFYDGGGKRLKAVRGGVTTHYIYGAGGNLLAEADGNNNITKYYIYGQGLLAMVTPTNDFYCYHFNGVGSTVAVTDSNSNQNVVNKYAYDPFGNISNQDEAIAQPFKYVGQFGVMTEANGYYYMRARYYDPKVSRFISEDPSGFSGGDINLYAYVVNNPINLIDITGKKAAWYHFYDGYMVGISVLGLSEEGAQAFGIAVSMVDFGTKKNNPAYHADRETFNSDPKLALDNARIFAQELWNTGLYENRAYAVHLLGDIPTGGQYYPGFTNISTGLTSLGHLINDCFSPGNFEQDILAPISGYGFSDSYISNGMYYERVWQNWTGA